MNIGFIIDSETLPPDLEAVLNQSKKSQHYNVSLIITYSSLKHKYSKQNFFQKVINSFYKIGLLRSIHKIFLTLIFVIERKLLEKNELELLSNEELNINNLGIPILRLDPIYSKSKLVVRFLETDLEIIKSKNLDFIIRGGIHILRGGILETCPYGVIGIHHGDNDFYRGLPSGFWEVFNQELRTGFIIQRLQETLDQGFVYYKGYIESKETAYKNSLYTHLKARKEFIRFIEDFAKSGSLPKVIESYVDYVPLTTTPTIIEQIKYLWKVHIKPNK